MARMLAYDPAQRITAQEALSHEYFTKGPKPSPNVFVPPVSACDVLTAGCVECL